MEQRMGVHRRAAWIIGLSLAGAIAAVASATLAQPAGQIAKADPAPASADAALSADLWRSARSGDSAEFAALLDRFAADPQPGLRAAAAQLRDHLQARDKTRADRIAEVRADLDKFLAAEQNDLSLAKALRAAIELHTLSTDKDAVLNEPRIRSLIEAADGAAHGAERRGDTLTAGELFVLLDALLDIDGTYKPDVRRIGARQEMLRLYVPQKLWELRNARALKEEDGKPLPPYNPFGDEWKDKLASIDQTLLERSIQFARRHVEQKPLADLLRGGIDHVRTMVTTTDLSQAFPGLANDASRAAMLAFLDSEDERLAGRGGDLDAVQIGALIDRLRRKNDATTKIATIALLHEFGNGVMSRLDEFSEIIWPDEVRRFNKNTQGRFVGVGIQIEYDEIQNIRVVTPLEGTPAQRAGIHPGDIIAKVDGRVVFGLSLDQAVDVITGPENTFVTLTIERKAAEPAPAAPAAAPDKAPEARKETLEFKLKRSVINVPTVKGWRRQGVKEDSWDWFVDKDSQIGYVRLSQFADSTGNELDGAIRDMKKAGLKGLILDLRFNPGGLLDQAVRISQRFIDVPDDYIVVSKGASGRLEDPHFTDPSAATLSKVPIVVLINEGSASASEIVSGALSTYAHRNQLDCVVLGARSYGKGSVQNVWPVTATSMIKVTTAYYMLPDQSIIHRRPGKRTWGIEPDLKIEMLPKQILDAILARRDADIVPLNENGAAADTKPRINPDDLIAKGTDLQLEAALLLLRGRAASGPVQQTATKSVK
jgi:carboxyl-terminal processing protease